MRWFATGQRIKEFEAFEIALILASGYVVDKNGIDILDGWWALRLPNWVWAQNPWWRPLPDRWGWAQKILMHTRSRGFFIHLDFDP